jgi:hypothetical protein
MTPGHAQATAVWSGAHTEPCDLRGNQAFDRSTPRRGVSAFRTRHGSDQAELTVGAIAGDIQGKA